MTLAPSDLCPVYAPFFSAMVRLALVVHTQYYLISCILKGVMSAIVFCSKSFATKHLSKPLPNLIIAIRLGCQVSILFRKRLTQS